MSRHAALLSVLVAASAVGTAQFTPPDAPAALRLTVNGNLLTLDWLAPVSGAVVATYVIEAGTVAGAANIAVFPTG